MALSNEDAAVQNGTCGLTLEERVAALEAARTADRREVDALFAEHRKIRTALHGIIGVLNVFK